MRNFIICSHPQISLARSVKENKVGGSCGRHGRGEMSAQCLGGELRGKGPLARARCRWENGIRLNVKESSWEYGVESVGSG
jgi:hypothetical protein